MSDAQFSSLSPNSSNDSSNRYIEDYELNDQETVSVISTNEKNVANLNDFDDIYDKIGQSGDPFLSDFMKEEYEDNVYAAETIKMLPCYDNLTEQNFSESNDLNSFFNCVQSENDLDEYLMAGGNYIDEISLDLLEYPAVSPDNVSIEGKLMSNFTSNKRPFVKQENYNVYLSEVPNKQRKIEITPQIRCHEWINKLKKIPENLSFKASGLLDRRKTKHHQILNDQDTDLYEDKMTHNKDQKPYVNKKALSSNISSISVRVTSIKKPLSISIISNRDPPFRSTNNTRNSTCKPFPITNEINSSDLQSHVPPIPVSNNSQILNSPYSGRSNSELIDLSRMPEPLRMGKRVSRRGQRFSLWQFLMCLLDSSRYKEHSTGIKWVHRSIGIFHIVDSKQVATLWGQYKERRDKMTYDSLARSLRHYYKKNLMAKINNRRLVYQIAQECLIWSSETFMKRNRD